MGRGRRREGRGRSGRREGRGGREKEGRRRGGEGEEDGKEGEGGEEEGGRGKGMNSFVPSTSTLWNGLPSVITCLSTIILPLRTI